MMGDKTLRLPTKEDGNSVRYALTQRRTDKLKDVVYCTDEDWETIKAALSTK